MKDTNVPSGILLLVCLQLTGVWCEADSAFIFSAVGSDVLLPCPAANASGCSRISWTFFGGRSHFYEVTDGILTGPKASRLSLLSNCSLFFRNTELNDVGSYECLALPKSTNVFLSLLSITSYSPITELQVGGSLVLSCVLLTFFDPGNCGSNAKDFRLSWTAEDGAELQPNNRYKLPNPRPCNITLVIRLEKEDNNRKWRCQVNAADKSVPTMTEFTSTFLFHNASAGESGGPSTLVDCAVQLPISRIVLCAALPLMVIIVGVISWRRGRVKANVYKSQIEVQQVI